MAWILFRKNLNVVMDEKSVFYMSFNGFIANSAQANWIATWKFYGSNDPTIPMEEPENTGLFHWLANLDKVIQKYIKPFVQLNTKNSIKNIRMPRL